MTRKEKITAGVEKQPKRKTLMAQAHKDEKASVAKVMLRNYQGSPRKMRMIIDQIRGKEVSLAKNILKFTAKAGAPAVFKLLQSAIASYEEKFEGERVEEGTHYVSTVYVDGGRMLKRMQPAPQGRGHIIRKRSCHVTLVIDKI